jgi:hypothetical protein
MTWQLNLLCEISAQVPVSVDVKARVASRWIVLADGVDLLVGVTWQTPQGFSSRQTEDFGKKSERTLLRPRLGKG